MGTVSAACTISLQRVEWLAMRIALTRDWMSHHSRMWIMSQIASVNVVKLHLMIGMVVPIVG